MSGGYTDVYLFRHGEARNNVESHLIGGRSEEAELVETGIAQAQGLGTILLEKGLVPDVVYSSTARRAKETGSYALGAMGLEIPIIEDERLHEQATGEWTGRIAADVFTEEMVRTIEASGKDFRSPGGESMNDVADRMQDWLESLSSGTAFNPRTVFAFTHGGAIRSLASDMLGWSHAQTYQTRPDNVSASTFKQTDGLWRPEQIGIAASELSVVKLVPAEISSRLASNELIRDHLQSVIWFGSLRNNRDIHHNSDYDVQIILDAPDPELAAQIGEVLRDYPQVDLSIMYMQDIFDHEGKMIFQDGTKGPFFMYVLGAGKIMYGRNVYAEATKNLTLEDLKPAILFTMREYLSRLRVMVVQSPHDTERFKRYSTKLFKDVLVYSGARSFETMSEITIAGACEGITQYHGFSEDSLKALSGVADYESPYSMAEMCNLLNDYEQIMDRICNE